MNIKSDKALTPIALALVAGLGLGLAYGIVKSFNIDRTTQILTFIAVLAICFLLFKSGKKSSYSEAMAWAQNEVNVAVEVYNQATSKAEALSMAYATAISSANASATNTIHLELPTVEKKTLTETEFEGIINAQHNAQPLGVSVGEINPQESQTLWQSSDPKRGIHIPL